LAEDIARRARRRGGREGGVALRRSVLAVSTRVVGALGMTDPDALLAEVRAALGGMLGLRTQAWDVYRRGFMSGPTFDEVMGAAARLESELRRLEAQACGFLA